MPYQAGPRNSGNAVAALVLAIASFVVCPVIPAIVALFLASSAKKEIRASNGAVTGESMATAGTINARINIGLAGLAIIGAVVLIAVGAGNSSTSAIFLPR